MVFPTHVGMVRVERCVAVGVGRFPHARGDGPSCASCAGCRLKFSPRTWGWSGLSGSFLTLYGVFPTHVGMVRYDIYCALPGQSFPHARGDGPGDNVLAGCGP